MKIVWAFTFQMQACVARSTTEQKQRFINSPTSGIIDYTAFHALTLGNVTRVPENPGKPGRFQTRKPGFESGQKPGFTGLILGVKCVYRLM